ncbi:hypothetical protein ACILE9_04405 [Capnocytophaga cynodegmi]|uniref:hypothetical protein n=1 Tax=Capnocytophaga cynodegmi TaxID=28189 RepID=UPI0037D5AC60
MKVQACRWFTTHVGFVNSDGFFECDGRFRRPANYKACFERYDFEIRNGWLSTAYLDRPKTKGSWNVDIHEDKYEFYATIFRAAHHYYYEDIKGLRRPPLNGFWKTQMKLRAYMENNNHSNGNHSAIRRFLGLGSAIKIYNPDRNSMDIYGTVIHELAHASHWDMDKSGYNGSSDIVAESWARGVQWDLTRMVYPSYRGGPFIRPNYTQVVVDMIDPNYLSNELNVNNGLWNDNVQGYTIRQIEDALIGQKTWNGWRDNIIRMYNNETEHNLPTLFEYWRTR